MFNPQRTVFINHSSQKFILNFKIDLLIDILIINFEVHELLKLSLSSLIKDTLDNNPEANIINNNSIPTKMIFKNSYKMGEINSNFGIIRQKLNENNNKRDELIKINILKCDFWLTFDNLLIIYNFFKFYLEQYDLIKVKILNPVDSNKEKEEDIIKSDNTNKELFELSPNKIINYILIRLINNCNNHFLDLVDNNLNISNIYNFSYFKFTQYLNLVDENKKEENIEKIKLLIKYLYNVLSGENNNKFIQVQLILFLVFLYGVKILDPNVDLLEKDIKSYFLSIINYCIKNIVEKYSKDKNVISIILMDTEDSNININLEEISNEFKYLKNIDSDAFIDKIIENINIKDKILNSPAQYKQYINNPIIFDINDFLNNNSENCLLSYKLIKNRIISKNYQDILLIESNRKIDLNSINNLVLKYSDIIINHIFKKINSSNIEIIDTLDILVNFIEPFLSTDTLEYDKQFILFQIVIPHIYNLYQINKIIDYFH